ncbi:MAG: hypothetical protein IPL32_19525 [Chloracidobacterium sp.]|nr:hypothetical protein [Chloracidobacterium sp.]
MNITKLIDILNTAYAGDYIVSVKPARSTEDGDYEQMMILGTEVQRRRGGITRNTEQIALRLPHELKAEIDGLSASRRISRTTILLEGAQLFMQQFAAERRSNHRNEAPCS